MESEVCGAVSAPSLVLDGVPLLETVCNLSCDVQVS